MYHSKIVLKAIYVSCSAPHLLGWVWFSRNYAALRAEQTAAAQNYFLIAKQIDGDRFTLYVPEALQSVIHIYFRQ